MKDYRWFKIMVRAFGLLLVGMSIPYLTSAIEYAFTVFGSGAMGSASMFWPRVAAYAVGALGQLLLGLYMLSGAPKFVRYCVDQADKRCIRCDYDLTGLAGTCPECGLSIPPRPPGTAA
jgi:hypothetical protein